MADKNKVNKILTFKVNQLNEYINKLKQATEAYVNQVTRSAQTWVNKSEDYDQQSFINVTLQLDSAMMFAQEKTSEIESELRSLVKVTESGPSATPNVSTSEEQTETEFEGTVLTQHKGMMSALEKEQSTGSAVISEHCDCRNTLDSLEDSVVAFGDRMSNMEKVVEDGITSIKALEEKLQQTQMECVQRSSEIQAAMENRHQETIDSIQLLQSLELVDKVLLSLGMASKSSMDKILTFRIGQLNEFNNRLKYVIDGHVNQVIRSAEMWINKSEGCNQDSFTDVTIQLDQAMMILQEKTSEIESSLGPKPLLSCSTVTSSPQTRSSSQINSGSQATDQMLCSLQERMDALENAASHIQELKTELDGYRKHVDSVEGIKANLENLVLQVESVVNDTGLQELQQKVKSYKSKELTRMRKFEDRLCKVENVWNVTDHQIREMNNCIAILQEDFCGLDILKEEISRLNTLKEEISELKETSFRLDDRLSDLEKENKETNDKILIEEKLSKAEAESIQMKELIDKEIEDRDKSNNKISVIEEKLSNLEIAITDIEEKELCYMDGRLQVVENEMKKALEKKSIVACVGTLQTADINTSEPRKGKLYIGFTASITNVRTVDSSSIVSLFDKVYNDDKNSFNNCSGIFIAPRDGTYAMIFVCCQIDNGAACFKVVHKSDWSKICVCTAWTVKEDTFYSGKIKIWMNAGDSLYVKAFRSNLHPSYWVPVFSCELVE